MRLFEGDGVVTTTAMHTNALPHPSHALKPTIQIDRPGPRLQLFTARGFEWTRATLPIPNLPPELSGFRILHLSDLHARAKWDPAYDELISRTRANPPDLLAFTGDFVDDKHDSRHQFPTARKLINALPSRLGAVTVLGNHDGDLLGPPLASLNITLIDHRCLSLHSAPRGGSVWSQNAHGAAVGHSIQSAPNDPSGATIELIGLPGVDRLDFDSAFLHSLGRKKPNTLRIALSHYPDLIRRTRFLEADIFLAGHTHGGQVCLPGQIPIIRHDSLPTKFIAGINRFHETWLIVNRGLGFSSYPIRLFCPAEVLEITLQPHPIPQ